MTEITIKGVEIKPRTILAKDLKKVTLLTYPFIDAFDELIEKKNRDIAQRDLYRLISKHADDFISFCVYMTELEREWVQNLSIDDLYKLGEKVIAVNADFFLTNIAGMAKLSNAIAKLSIQAMLIDVTQATGLKLSANDLSQADTSAPTL